MLTAYDDEEAVYAAVLAGAAGYVLKDIRGTGLVDAVRAVAAGRRLLDPTLRRAATTALTDTQSTDPRLAGLGLRERQILGHIAEGMTNRQIGVEPRPRREDRQELRLEPPRQARPRAAHPGGGAGARAPSRDTLSREARRRPAGWADPDPAQLELSAGARTAASSLPGPARLRSA